jgi:hypothetical protein
MSDPRRRYFVATGPDTNTLLAKLTELYDAHRQRTSDYVAQYGAKFVWQSGGRPEGFLVPIGTAAPPGFKKQRTVEHKGVQYDVMAPHGNGKEARAARAAADRVGYLLSSEVICQHFGVRDRMFIVGGNMSWHATGWANIEQGLATLQVPETHEDRYVPTHPELREISYSQYVAITEDGAPAPEAEQASTADTLATALQGMLTMHDAMCKKVNLGASFLDAETIAMMNEAPIAARRALADFEKVGGK